MHANNLSKKNISKYALKIIKYDNLIKRVAKFYYSRVDLSASCLPTSIAYTLEPYR